MDLEDRTQDEGYGKVNNKRSKVEMRLSFFIKTDKQHSAPFTSPRRDYRVL